MTTFKFDEELKKLKSFYDYTAKLYSWRASAPGDDLGVVKTLGDPNLPETLRKAVMALMCALWETLIFEIKTNDRPKYATKIQVLPQTRRKWTDGRVLEIALIRHCLMHNNGVINQKYMDKSGNPFGYRLGDNIKLDDKIDKFFTDIDAAFVDLMA